MKKIDNWENVKESTDGFERIPAGGYVVAVTSVQDVPEKEYLRVEFDVCEGQYKLFFTNSYKNDTRETKYWPNGGYTMRSYKDKALPMFKGFTTAIENSNPGYKWDWDEKTLKNKKFGVVIADEEYESKNGKVYERSYVASIRSVDSIKSGDFKVPELKKLKQTMETKKTDENFVNPFTENANTTISEQSFADDENPFL